MADWFDGMNKIHWQTAANPSTASAPPLTLKSLCEIMEKIKPPPKREFIFDDGMVHGVYEEGRFRVSQLMLDKLKERFRPFAVEVAMTAPAGISAMFQGIPVTVDEKLPRPAFKIHQP